MSYLASSSKMFLKFLLVFILISYVVAFTNRDLLSTKKCTWGPTFWCGNITNAKSCGAVKHCTQTVWELQEFPQDNDSICDTCKKMIQEARTQLESNETIDMIKQVFEWSCKLIHLKPIVKECELIADKYAPELVDLLSSQMNPGVICSVVGLCNNAIIDKMLEDTSEKKLRDEERTRELQKDCSSCLDFADVIGDKIEKATKEDLQSYLLQRCRAFGSLSDSCANIVMEYSPDLYEKLRRDFTPSSLCYLTCINGYTRKIQIKTESDVGVIHVNNDAVSVAVKHLSEDQTCELCKQLVKHLKDVLTLNTTEVEFKQVLKGICRQTGRFKDECLSIADQYYDRIYQFLVHDMNGEEICSFAGICAKPGIYINGPTAPLMPSLPYPLRGKIHKNDDGKFGRISVSQPDSNIRVFSPFVQSPVKVEISFGDPLESKFQLPVERMVVPSHSKDLDVNNREACIFCQYLLHYVQKAISQPYGEEKLKNLVNKACDILPKSVTVECKSFVEEFGDSFVAILAQEIDPSQVCPALRICPARELEDKYEPLEIGGKPGCPLCLMAIEDITEKLKDNKTEESIRHALKTLCLKLPASLKGQCQDFVNKYSEEIVDMIIADFTPQEVCTFLKLCHPKTDIEVIAPQKEEVHILTNEIPHEDLKSLKRSNPPLCILCEFIMDKIDDRLKDNYTDEEVKRVVKNVCQHMPKSVKPECLDFVGKYSHFILEILADTKPKMVCAEMHMCREPEGADLLSQVHRAVETCALCEAIVGALRGIAEDKTLDGNIAQYVTRICTAVKRHDECRSMIMSYGPSIIYLLTELEVRPSLICPKLHLCDSTQQMKVVVVDKTSSLPQQHPQLIGGNSCTWGPSYWCQSEDHAKKCGTLAHCREVVWKSERPVPAA